jgi:hypothetical protein
MLQKMRFKFNLSNHFNAKTLAGDWLVIIVSVIAITFLFQHFWRLEHPSTLKIRLGDKVVGTYDLNQLRELKFNGPIGVSIISIHQGKVRFKQSPCHNQYCVHQGWLSHAGQVAICIPNQLSIHLLGKQSSYDSVSY